MVSKPLPKAPYNLVESSVGVWLQKIIEGMNLEGLYGVLVMCGDKDNFRHEPLCDAVQHLETIHFRYANIQENNLWLETQDRFGSLLTAQAFANNLAV